MDEELTKDFSPVEEKELDTKEPEVTGSFLQKKKILIIIVAFCGFVFGIFLLINFNLRPDDKDKKTGKQKNTENIRAPKLDKLWLVSESDSNTSVMPVDSEVPPNTEITRWKYRALPTMAPVHPIVHSRASDVYDTGSALMQKKLAEEAAARGSGGRIGVGNNSKINATYMPTEIQPYRDSGYHPTRTESTGQTALDEKSRFYAAEKKDTAVYGFLPSYNLECSLQPGTVIDAVLLTAINSDLPGNIVAVVTKNVYDSHSLTNLLIPQGTKLLAHYNSSVSYGANRVQIAWSDLYRPDGIVIHLGNMPGVDSTGATGYRGRVNNHNWEVLKGVGLLAAFSILDFEMAYNAAALNSPGAVNFAADMQDTASTVGEAYVGRAMDIQPTITVDSGCEINVFIDSPIILPPFTWNS